MNIYEFDKVKSFSADISMFWLSTVDATCAKFCYHQKAGHETRPKNQCTEASFPFGTPAFVLNASYARLWCPTQLPLLHLIFAFDSNSLTKPLLRR